jgi:hypothetical protein
MPVARETGGYAGTIVVDVPQVRRASGVVADAAHAYSLLAARVRGRPFPEMPPGVAERVQLDVSEVCCLLGSEPQRLIEAAQELRVRAFWAEIADRLAGGYDLNGAALTEFKAAYASGLLLRYAESWQVELGRAYAQELHDREHPGGLAGFLKGAGDFFTGAWDAIKDPAVMLYQLTPLSDGWTGHWSDLGHGLASGITHPVEMGKALVNLDALHERGFAYWIGNLAPAAAATVLSGGAAAGVRGAEGAAALDRAAQGAVALTRAERALGAAQKPAWLVRIEAGTAFNLERRAFYDLSEVYVDKAVGSGYFRLDSYDHGVQIVSRKFTQLGEVRDETAMKYLREIDDKYAPGRRIADVPSTPDTLRGELLRGQKVLEVPVQTKPIPQSVLDLADDLDIEIRDVNGHIYNPPPP